MTRASLPLTASQGELIIALLMDIRDRLPSKNPSCPHLHRVFVGMGVITDLQGEEREVCEYECKDCNVKIEDEQ